MGNMVFLNLFRVRLNYSSFIGFTLILCLSGNILLIVND